MAGWAFVTQYVLNAFRVRLRVISTSPSAEKPLTLVSPGLCSMPAPASAARVGGDLIIHIDEINNDNPAQIAQP